MHNPRLAATFGLGVVLPLSVGPFAAITSASFFWHFPNTPPIVGV
jgi:hypothetical protein